MGAGNTTRILHEGVEGFREYWFGGVRNNIENENFAVVESSKPEVAPVIGETTMMSFVATTDGYT